MNSWFGLVAPAGTPRAIVDQLHVAVRRILQLPDVHRKLVAMGTEPAASTPDEFAAEIRDSLQRWPAVVKAAGIRAE
jgi:tripartite-type tricarboxylate transporter receptor subunit TctC